MFTWLEISPRPGTIGVGNGPDPNVIAESTENMQKAATFIKAGWKFAK